MTERDNLPEITKKLKACPVLKKLRFSLTWLRLRGLKRRVDDLRGSIYEIVVGGDILLINLLIVIWLFYYTVVTVPIKSIRR